jgi:type II secretory pathway component PulF
VAWYHYEGQTADGTAVEGRLEAPDHDTAMATLREAMGLDVMTVTRIAPPAEPRTVGADDFIFFNEQLAAMAAAGIPLETGLDALVHDVHSPRLRGLIHAVADDLHHGLSLDQAVANHERQLPMLYSRVLRAGIRSGDLTGTLLGLNQHLPLMRSTRRVLWETLTYPIFALLLALGIVSFFFEVIVPQFGNIFADFNTALPGVTIVLLDVAAVYPLVLLVGGVMIASLVIIWKLMRFSESGRRIRESILTAIPVVGRAVRLSLLARFVRSVSTCVQSGLPLPDAFRLAADATGSTQLSHQASRLALSIERGESLTSAARLCPWIPSLVTYTLDVAMTRNNVPEALRELSDAYFDRAVESHRFASILLIPILIIAVGLIVGYMVLGMFLPLVHLINSVSG